jgi:nucleotide-binding universal stress UspA family protein
MPRTVGRFRPPRLMRIKRRAPGRRLDAHQAGRRAGTQTGRTANSPDSTTMYAKILVPVDGSRTSEAGLAEAIQLARMSGGAIRLLHVVEELPYLPEAANYAVHVPDLTQDALERGKALLERCRARVAQAGVAVAPVLVESQGRHLEDFVAEEVSAGRADLVVLGTHGRRGIGRLLLGSDAEQVVRKSRVPVLLVRQGAAQEPGAGLPAHA